MDGFRGPRKGRSEPMVLSEKTLYSLGRRCVYIFKRRKAKKEIPVKRLFDLGIAPIAAECPADVVVEEVNEGLLVFAK